VFRGRRLCDPRHLLACEFRHADEPWLRQYDDQRSELAVQLDAVRHHCLGALLERDTKDRGGRYILPRSLMRLGILGQNAQPLHTLRAYHYADEAALSAPSSGSPVSTSGRRISTSG